MCVRIRLWDGRTVASGAFGKMLTLLLEKQCSSLWGSEVFKEKPYKETALEGGRDKKDRLPAVVQPFCFPSLGQNSLTHRIKSWN